MSELNPYLLVSQYYRQATTEEQDGSARGQIYSCPCLYFRSQVQLLRLKYSDPYDKNPTLFELTEMDKDSFTDTTHKPILNPQLQADEELSRWTEII